MSSTTIQTQTQTQVNSSFSLNSSQPEQKQSIHANLNFFVQPEDGSVPYNYVETPPEGVPRTNVRWEELSIPIHDMRGRESDIDINKQAFLPLPASAETKASKADFSSDESVKETYYPEVEELLLTKLPGTPNKVIIFDHTIRRQAPGSKREPVLRVHIDQTIASAIERVRLHAPEEADKLLASRVRLVNVWRPLNGTVESSPLAVADSSTVDNSQIVGVEHRYPHRTGETAGVLNSDKTKWYYWSGMQNDERLLLQCYDSETGTRVPHTAFQFPGERQEGWTGKPRESIEVRALIFG